MGTGKVLDAVGAVREVGVTNRSDFYWALHSVFVNRRDQHDLFDQAFHIFWRDPKILERMMGIVMPEAEVAAPPRSRRAAGCSKRSTGTTIPARTRRRNGTRRSSSTRR